MESSSHPAENTSVSPLPRITIRFCTQCKWLLRAAYFAQELLSTFSTSLGEVALQPATGGVFVVEISTALSATATATTPQQQRRILWDRKADGGFPDTAELKRRVRDAIDPDRDLGHVDRASSARHHASSSSTTTTAATAETMTSPAAPEPAAPRPTSATTTTAAAASEDAIPRPRDLAAGRTIVDRIVPAGVGGVKPMIRAPPAHLQQAAEARLAETRRRREDAAAAGGEGKGEEKREERGGDEKPGCEDCK